MDSLDMALDEIIEKNRRSSLAGDGAPGRGAGRARGRGRGRGRGGRGRGGGGARYFGPFSEADYATGYTRVSSVLRVRRRPIQGLARPSSFQLSKPFLSHGGFSDGGWCREMLQEVTGSSAIHSVGIETGTKLYISNLEYGVSNEDIKELFSEVGDLKRFSIHYDRSGRSKGTAEVVYSRRQDALSALNQYNNVLLDGKPMKIELIGSHLLQPLTQPVNVPPVAFSTARHNPIIRTRGRGFRPRRFIARGRGRGKRQYIVSRGEKNIPTAEELDAELDKYHQDAM